MAGDDHCPSEQTLIDFAAATLSGAAADQVSEHLERCTPCAEAIDWIKCHLLRPRHEDDDEEPTGIGIHSESSSNSDEAKAGAEDFDWEHLPQSLLEGAVGRLDSYDILGTIGQGAMGVVLRGWDERLRRFVAIKVLRKSLASHTISKQRFLREARAAAAIAHPHVVTIHAVDEFRGIPYFVMELVAGRNLRQILTRESRLEFDFIRRIGEQMASAVAAAHAQQILHRDLKPSNFLVDDVTGCGKLTDFGLAKWWTEASDLTAGELTLGTPAYMAPEQVAGNPCDYRSDLFALGCVFYELATGKSPFRGRGQMAALFRVDAYQPPPLCDVRPDTPRRFSELVALLLEKDPAHRLVTADEVVVAFQEWREDDLRRRRESPPPTSVPATHPESMTLGPESASPVALDEPRPAAEIGPYFPFPQSVLTVDPQRLRESRQRDGLSRIVGWIAMAVVAVVAWLLGNRDGRLTVTPRGESLRGTVAHEQGGESRTTSVARSPLSPALPVSSSVPASPPTPQRSSVIRVSQDGRSDVRTIGEALRLAGPGCQILVQDDRVYEETILLAGPGWRGVSLEATAGATLRHSSEPALITLDGVRDVAITGFRLEPGNHQQACDVRGPCPGSRLEKLHILQPHTAEVFAVRLHSGAGGAPQAHFQLSSSNLVGPRLLEIAGMALEPVGRISVEENLFEGVGTVRPGTAISLYGALEDVTVGQNIVRQIHDGIELTPTRSQQIHGLRIVANRVSSCERWLVVAESFLDQPEVEIERNILTRVAGFGISESGLARIEQEWFFGNAWEISPTDAAVDRSRARRIAEVYDSLPFIPREAGSPDFLKLERPIKPSTAKEQARR